MRGETRPLAAAHPADRLKLHRRRLRLNGREYTVVTLRPDTDARFATNLFHETWHVLSDWRGARVLGRLLWGLAYQRVPGTLVLIDPRFLDPNPFDAEPSDPIALVPARLTPWDARTARELRRRLPLRGGPDGTVRWYTPGLGPAVVERRRVRAAREDGTEARVWTPDPGFQRIGRVGGILTFTGTPAALEADAVDIYELGEYAMQGMDYVQFDHPRLDVHPLGEVQVFDDYRRRVSAARTARREVLAELPDRPDPEVLRSLVRQRGTEVRRRSTREFR